ncbi:glycoside hydrolase [Mycena metata]|uniref:alpha-1,2-Mannosidase n=1 Tax=Mycena metata TaxID=1033252 RepID=A0AAD7HHH3_9AGAR|nr:glycoside hydrolase [Mycena metata]
MFLERAAELGARLLPAFGASDDADSDSDSHSPDVDASASSSHVDAPASSSDVDDDEHTHAHAHAHGASWGAEAPAGSGSDGVVGSPDPVPSQRLRDSGIPSAEVWLGERDPPAAPDLSLSDVDAFVGGEAVYADSEPVRPKGGDPARPPSRGGMVRRALAGEGHASSDASSSDSVSPDNLTGQSQSQSETTTTTTTRPSRPRPPPAPKTKPRPKWPEREDTSIAEAATLQLEFRYLAHAVREWNDKNSTHQILPHGVQPEEFWYKAENVMRVLNRERLESGLAPHKINTTDGTFMRSSVRMGSSGDSYYEYLLKQYIQTNRTESVYLQMYTDAMRAVHEHMVQRTPWKAYTYITELVPVPGRDDWTGLFASLPKQDHLACFLAGSLMLGATRVHIQDPALAVVESSVPESDAPLDPLDPPPQVAQRPVSPIVDAAPPLIVDKVVSPMLDFDGQPPMPDVVDGQPNQRRAPVPQRPLTAAEAEEMGKNLQHLRASVPPRVRELSVEGRRDWDVGVALLEGCMDTTNTVTGLAPETVWWRADGQPAFAEDFDEFGRRQRDWYIMAPNKFWPPYDARYILRPEIAESVFLAWRLTGARHYRTYAWKIFKAIEMYCRLPEGGYATVMDVDNVPVKYDDKQETFFLSETLKYLYLTFADENVLDLNEVVFNTEAHPLPIFTPTIKPRFTEYSPLKPAPGTRYL